MVFPLHEEKTMKVVYKLVLSHSSSINPIYLNASVKDSANLFLAGVLNDCGHILKGPQGEGTVTLETVHSEIDYLSSATNAKRVGGVCDSSDDAARCTILNLEAELSYTGDLSEDDIRFEFLQYAKDICFFLSNEVVHSRYIGDIPIETTTKFNLSGGRLQILNEEDSFFFKKKVKKFLDEVFVDGPFNNFNVNINTQEVGLTHVGRRRLEMNRSLNEVGRLRESQMQVLNLKITASITGYFINAPPMQDFGPSIDKAFEQNGETFIKVLNTREGLSSVARGVVKSTYSIHTIPTLPPTSFVGKEGFLKSVQLSQTSIFVKSTTAIPFYALISTFVLVIILFYAQKTKVEIQEEKVVSINELMKSRTANNFDGGKGKKLERKQGRSFEHSISNTESTASIGNSSRNGYSRY